MDTLRLRRRVNRLTAESLAAALITGAAIRVTFDTPLLRDACDELGIDLQVVIHSSGLAVRSDPQSPRTSDGEEMECPISRRVVNESLKPATCNKCT
jgi:hypothetical protein